MKKVLSISFVFIGLVIGAGFASGREILEYFCIPSRTDFTGICLAAISFGAICYIIMHLAQKSKSQSFDELISALSGRFAPPIRLFMLLFMFCGLFVMMSACGVIAEEAFGLSPQCGIWLLALVCFAVFSFDVKGLVAINTLLVPLMLAGMVFVCLASTAESLPAFAPFEKLRTNPLISALCYVSYNTVTAGAVLVPLSISANKKQIAFAAAVGGFVLGILIFISWICMNRFFDSLLLSEMPLLTLAEQEGTLIKNCYTMVLFMALCTTAVSHGFGILSKFRFRKTVHRVAASALLCLAAIPFAGMGFSSLVSNLYSAFGFIGFLWTAIVLWKYIRL